MTEGCIRCKFALVRRKERLVSGEDITVHCRRSPPAVHEDYRMGQHPEVSPDGWCGEFKAKG